MKTMTEAEYVDRGGNSCPACGSDKISTRGQVETDCALAWQKVECEGCGASWTDAYVLSGYSDLVDGDGNPVPAPGGDNEKGPD